VCSRNGCWNGKGKQTKAVEHSPSHTLADYITSQPSQHKPCSSRWFLAPWAVNPLLPFLPMSYTQRPISRDHQRTRFTAMPPPEGKRAIPLNALTQKDLPLTKQITRPIPCANKAREKRQKSRT
jgi:hypothetical protein